VDKYVQQGVQHHRFVSLPPGEETDQ